jgi:hypothetical protein
MYQECMSLQLSGLWPGSTAVIFIQIREIFWTAIYFSANSCPSVFSYCSRVSSAFRWYRISRNFFLPASFRASVGVGIKFLGILQRGITRNSAVFIVRNSEFLSLEGEGVLFLSQVFLPLLFFPLIFLPLLPTPKSMLHLSASPVLTKVLIPKKIRLLSNYKSSLPWTP